MEEKKNGERYKNLITKVQNEKKKERKKMRIKLKKKCTTAIFYVKGNLRRKCHI